MSGAGYPNLFITLFGPRNETLFGELNITGMTLPRKDTRLDDVGVAASSSSSASSFVRSGYDSRGAAYYICIVILVYALAIAAFVVSLARRRNARDKYRLAHDQITDYQPREERRQGGCWKQRCSASSEFPGAPSSPWSPSSSSSTSSNEGIEQQRPDALMEDGQVATTAEGIMTPPINVQIDSDEVITLVQVWPYSNNSSSSSSEGLKTSEADGGALNGEYTGTFIPVGHELEAGQQQKRFRWSMGPDGNIWILQVDDSVVIDNTKNNNDNTPSNNNLGCQLQPTTDAAVGPNQPSKDTPFVQLCPSSAATAVKGPPSSGANTVQQAKADHRRPKNLAFSPVPKGYKPRGRSSSRERKTRQLHSDEQGPNTTSLPTEDDPCSSTGEKTNSLLLVAREQHWEEYHFLDPEPFCLPPLVSPHLMQKLIHVTSV